MIYKYKTGCFHAVDAATAAAEMNRLAETGSLTARNLVEAARPEDAPLHKEFEWDDAVAGEKWREQQARVLIAHVVMVREDTKAEPVRAFFHIDGKANSNYEHTEMILQTPDRRALLLENAKNELRAFRLKYNGIKELAGIFAEIEKLEDGAA